MAKLWTTGPALMFWGTPLGPMFLGTAEEAPDVDLIGGFQPIMNDLAGSILPMDRIWEGEEAVASMVLTFWNEDTLDFIRGVTFGGVPGVEFMADIGTIMGQEGAAGEFWMQFPFSAKPAMDGMKAGYHFLSAFRIGTHKHQPGTGVNRHHLLIQCQRKLNAVAPSNLNARIFTLYDHDMSAIAGVPIE